VITLQISQVDEIFSHADNTKPAECCGLVGGTSDSRAKTVYQMRNVATNPLVSYEAAPEELFTAQRKMRERGEQLLAIYHSHPRSAEPQPSDTDVRLAYYPSAFYLIIGFKGDEPVMRAFRISESERRWELVEYEVVDE
jgi:[CysO sulfur-carrier protein]-S-L-cysteine hydrolase